MTEISEAAALTHSGLLVTAIIAAGLGACFLLSDWKTPSSRWIAGALLSAAAGIATNAYLLQMFADGTLPWWARLAGFIEAMAFIAGVEWGMRVSRTASDRRTPEGRRFSLARLAQVLIVVYAVLAATFPDLRMQHFIGALGQQDFPSIWFWLFTTPPTVAFILIFVATLLMLRTRPDKAEAGRVISMLVVLPLLGVSFIVPVHIAPLTLALAEVVFIYGALRYFMVQGARAQFMARFMAPQVADMVRTRGLRQAMKRRRVLVSIVCVDIRGFTGYAQSVEPEVVLRLLRDFYAAIGTAAAYHGGTIKDLAGDGALIVIGAPVPVDDHAARALRLARRLQSNARAVVRRYDSKLGLGVGVATGEVAVGIVGQRARFEYVAVGPAVNLASRLCDRARDGEIRSDAETLELAGEPLRGRSLRRYVKGMREPVATYTLRNSDSDYA